MCAAELLIIDDFASLEMDAAQATLAFQVISERYDYRLSTGITTARNADARQPNRDEKIARFPKNPTHTRSSLRLDRRSYARRYRVEVFFHDLERFRAIATRFEKRRGTTSRSCSWNAR